MNKLTAFERELDWEYLDGDRTVGCKKAEGEIDGETARKICELIGLNPNTTQSIELHALSFGAPNWEIIITRSTK